MLVYFLFLLFTCYMYIITHKVKFVGFKEKKRFLFPIKDENKNWNMFSFAVILFILAFFSAVRDGIGVDYAGYVNHVTNIQMGRRDYMEPGFQLLVKACYFVSHDPRFVIIICSILTCYFYLRAIYEQSEDVLLSIFLFISWGYYFLTFNTVRNYLALSIALYSLRYLKEKRYVHFIILALIAASIHKSALVIIPLYIIANRRIKPYIYVFIIFVPIIGLFFKDYFKKLAMIFYASYFGSAYDSESISFFNILKGAVVVGIGLLFYKKFKKNDEMQLLFNLNIFSLVFYLGFYWLPEISRIGFFMNATTIMFIPSLIKYLNEKNKKILRICFVAGSIVLFFFLMREYSSPTIRLLPYKTWLFD